VANTAKVQPRSNDTQDLCCDARSWQSPGSDYRNGKLLTKPCKAAVQRVRRWLAAEVKALHGANAQAMINKLNPVIRGWAAYYRAGVSKEIFSSLDATCGGSPSSGRCERTRTSRNAGQ
jgi:hypothetical protein